MLQYLYKNNRKFSWTAHGLLSLTLAVFCLTGASAQQTAGNLDATFDGDGKIVAGVGANPDTLASSVVVQPDGKTIVAGLTGAIDLQGETPGSSDFLVLRYNADGTPDTTFDGDGRVVTSFGDGEDGAGAVLIQPDGKILVAGAINMKAPLGEIALARYNADGSLDTTFDGDGKVTTDAAEFQNVEERAEALILQPDGKILVLVSTVKENPLEDQVFVVRYNADGSRDTTFAGDGITTLPWAIPGGPGGNIVQGLTGNDIALQPDGKIVVAGTVTTEDFADVFVWRINADGTNDETFGGRAVTVSFNLSDLAVAVFVRPDNKILVAGSSFSDDSFRNDFTFARFNADGTPDATFDGDGKKTTLYGGTGITIPLDYEIQADGKIVSAGPVIDGAAGFKTNFAVTRFDANGNRDTTFGNDGRTVTEFGDGLDSAQALTIQTNGKIIAAGVTETEPAADDFNLAVARYLGDASDTPRAPYDFDGDGKTDIGVWRPTSGSWWYLHSSDLSGHGHSFGLPDDIITPGDFTGDGKTDVAIWRPSTGEWFVRRSEDGSYYSYQFGLPGDIPAPADYDGDGVTDTAVFRPSTAAWYIFHSGGSGYGILTFGLDGDKPVPADYDGDGKADICVWRPSNGTWWIVRSSDLQQKGYGFGLGTDKPVPGDYTGDGKADIAVWRDATREWFFLRSEDGSYFSYPFGLSGDIPAPGDYDGDGRFDSATFRPSTQTWYINGSTAGSMITTFGLDGDRPVANAYVP